MRRFNIKPAREGLIVRDPITLKQLAAEGEQKPTSSYWLRRIRDNDVVEVSAARKRKKSVDLSAEKDSRTAEISPEVRKGK
jgi:hypothetical protein